MSFILVLLPFLGAFELPWSPQERYLIMIGPTKDVLAPRWSILKNQDCDYLIPVNPAQMSDTAPQLTLPDSTSFPLPQEWVAGKLPLPALWDHHRKHLGGHPLFVYADDTQPTGTTQILWSQGFRAMDRMGHFLKPLLPSGTGLNTNKALVVGVLAYKDVPTCWAILTAIFRLGATAFIISPTNSPTSLASILRDSKCGLLVTGSDHATTNLVEAAKRLMHQDNVPLIVQPPTYTELYVSDGEVSNPFPDANIIKLDAPAMIMHSSGSSTGIPTLVTSTHRALVHQAIMTYFGDKDMYGIVCGAQGYPIFHNSGISAYIAVASATGHIPTIFDPLQPPPLITAENTLQSAVACKAKYIYTVPSFIEAFVGSPLKTHIGDYLAQQGLRLVSRKRVQSVLFDMVDIRAPNDLHLPGGDPADWEYIQATRQTTVLWEAQEGSEGLFEPVVLESELKQIPKPNTTRLGRPACKTGDLFEKHPTKEGLWLGKTDPMPIEAIISQHPLVQYAIVFGTGRPRPGVLIWPQDDTNRESLRDEIWPAVEAANAVSPEYSNIPKATVIIGSPAKPFALTVKQSLRRNAILMDYTDEISEVFMCPITIYTFRAR
ncbi:hypothetical protein C8R46DRAFT_1287477 [Mycena filopes]|nr:hypothetical protein C8R46DRAFT_1287477 [Mycena filopes]